MVTALPRHEVSLWQRVAARTPRPLPDFADHGVTHPRLPRRRGFGRAVANLRYTHGPTWKVVRALKGMDTVGLCRDLAPFAAWPADPDSLPWGDQQLLARARGREPRPGAPKNWRAWDTSHHLATVVQAIASTGSPT